MGRSIFLLFVVVLLETICPATAINQYKRKLIRRSNGTEKKSCRHKMRKKLTIDLELVSFFPYDYFVNIVCSFVACDCISICLINIYNSCFPRLLALAPLAHASFTVIERAIRISRTTCTHKTLCVSA